MKQQKKTPNKTTKKNVVKKMAKSTKEEPVVKKNTAKKEKKENTVVEKISRMVFSAEETWPEYRQLIADMWEAKERNEIIVNKIMSK